MKSLNELIDSIEVDIIDTRELYEEAVNQSHKKDKTILNQDNVYRWMVNSVRHAHSNYNKSIKELHRNPDFVQDNYHLYKNAVLNRISILYPNLIDECNNQKETIFMVELIKERRNKNDNK